MAMERNVKDVWRAGAALAMIATIASHAVAQLPSQTIPAPNTRASRRMLNAQNCHLDFAWVRDVPLRVYVPNTRADSMQPAGTATSVIPAGDSTGANCFVTTFFAAQPAAYFQPQPVVMTVTPPGPSATPIGFVPRKIIMSSSGGEVALPFKPTADTGVIKQVKRPPR